MTENSPGNPVRSENLDLAAIMARHDSFDVLSPSWEDAQEAHADRAALLAEVERLRGTSTPEIEANIGRLAFKLAVTLGHLRQTGGRKLACLLQRLEKAEADAAALREALAALITACRKGREVVSPGGVGGMTLDACIDRKVIHGVRLRAVVDAEAALDAALAAAPKSGETT